MASNAPVMARSCCRSSINPRATNGNASPVAPVINDRTAPPSNAQRCGRTYPSNSRQGGTAGGADGSESCTALPVWH
ncbi:hypothetical protein GCM10023080_075650 [Streptomyces pseudoechinosporeus]